MAKTAIAVSGHQNSDKVVHSHTSPRSKHPETKKGFYTFHSRFDQFGNSIGHRPYTSRARADGKR